MTLNAAYQGRIGPNAVIRLVEALDAFEGRAVTTRLFSLAGVENYIGHPPTGMVHEGEVTALHKQLRAGLSSQRAASISWIAGLRTADYLLENRIPKLIQRLLKLLPNPIAARLLLKAIGRHAWTFVGSGQFSWKAGRVVTLTFDDCPLCRGSSSSSPCCQYYAAVFEHLFRVLIKSDSRVTETECIASGAEACRFEVRW
jgi:divinyl protochlorophyllide a 8-vinyl-reductase